MKHCLICPFRRTAWLAVVTVSLIGTNACMRVATIPSAQAEAGIESRVGAFNIPGVPNLPDVVTVVPFYHKANETTVEQTKVVISAAVDGVHGLFVLDLGAPRFNLNRTFLQPSPTGGVDTVSDANRISERGVEDSVHVKVRIGTLSIDVVDPMVPADDPHHPNAFLNHMWGNFSWVFAPRLGNIGLSVLEPFETIIDYTHQRVVLIRVDSAGHRLADVPAYTPRWSAPLVDVSLAPDARRWWGTAVRPDDMLDTVNTSRNIKIMVMDTGAPTNGRMLGYPFLSQFGEVGFNPRGHQFMLYNTTDR